MINIIVATDINGGIGKDNTLPWGRIKEDMKHFKSITTGHTVVMGRKTFESIGKPLPNRHNIVLSKSNINIEGVDVYNSYKDIIRLHSKNPNDDIFIIGGQSIYQLFKDLADRIYLTLINDTFDCDTHFRYYNDNWVDIYHKNVNNGQYELDFYIKERRHK